MGSKNTYKLKNTNWIKNLNSKETIQPAHYVPKTSHNGPTLFETSRTIIGPKYDILGFLTYFGFTMSGVHLASGNIEKFP